MEKNSGRIFVGGHICLDIIPAIPAAAGTLADIMTPGKLVGVEAGSVSTGGVVANTGLSLFRLGFPVGMMGKVGRDMFGGTVLAALRASDPSLADGMIVHPEARTSYTMVVSPPGVDRIFLHCHGANDTFCAEDPDYGRLAEASVFHFGYPPLMRRMYSGNGRDLAEVLRRAGERGPVVSLDMAFVDPASDSGRADWPAILATALPHADVFLPSLDEILYMLDRPRHRDLAARAGAAGLARQAGHALLREVSGRLLAHGVPVVGLKLGDQGLYLRTGADSPRLRRALDRVGGRAADWISRELLAPCFQVRVAGTTGSGDATIAGFLAGLSKGLGPEETLQAAAGTGACSVEAVDAVSGVRSWGEIGRRIALGWEHLPVAIDLPGWRTDHKSGLRVGPGDRG